MTPEHLQEIEERVGLSDVVESLSPGRPVKWPPIASDMRALVAAVRGRNRVMDEMVKSSIALGEDLLDRENRIRELEQDKQYLRETLDAIQHTAAVGFGG